MAVKTRDAGIRTQTDVWPSLPLSAWEDTYATLHLWTQIVGKIRMALAPPVNHWWHVPFYITPTGFTTSAIPYENRIFQIDFDFLAHELRIETDRGDKRHIPLRPRSVADFYRKTMDALHSLDIDVKIWTTPVEIPDRTPFEKDTKHASYDPEFARRCWQAFVQVDRVFEQFRSRYIGKVSPVHLFWGFLDLAVTRFSGKRAPQHPGSPNVGRSVMLEAYSHEVSSCGFWPGLGIGEPAFYTYFYPEPEGFKESPVRPDEAYYSRDFGEFILPYEAVRTATDPEGKLLDFLQTTYEAGARLGRWNRSGLEREID